MWIKICGNTSLEDARMAVEAGADAVGFVFAASPRQVTVETVAAICSELPPAVEKIGVFVDEILDAICETVRTCGLTGVQLHFHAPADLPAQLRQRLGPELRILRVVHFDGGAAQALADLARDPHVDGLLVDSCTAAAVGGTGIAFDWSAARQTVFANAGALKLIAAGGLTPANVTEAIQTLRPWGVDVVSGVEATPGHKHPDKVRAFIAAARVAAQAPVRRA